MKLWCATVGAAVLAVTGLHAQTSQPSDSITRLALNPAGLAGVPLVTLLDESYLRVEPDGRNTRRRRQVVQVVSDAAARAKAEQSFSYLPGHQTFTLHWVRVLKPSGEVLSDKPAQEQDADVPVAMRNPVYQEQKIRRLSLAGVSAGTIVDVSWTVEEKAPYRPGDFYDMWFVNSPVDVVRSRYVLDTPAGFAPRIVERNLTAIRTDSLASGRRITTWAAGNLPGVRNEAFPADSNGIVQSISVSPPTTWAEVALWYHGLSKDRYTLSPDIARRIDSLVMAAGARTRGDTIRALHRWVAQDVRYVSIALGIGGYQPRTPAQVLDTGFGDCKDKATLFVAAARKYGIEASPVLLSIAGRANRGTPSIFQFDHAIAAVRNGKSWTFTDLTAEAVPYGIIPPSYQGSLGVLVLPDGRAEEVTFPLSPIDSNASTVRVTGAVQADGAVALHVDDRGIGAPSLRVRESFYAPLDSAGQAAALRALSLRYFKDALGDGLVVFNGRDLSSDVRIQFDVTAANALRSVGTLKLLAMPPALRGPAASFGALAGNLAAAPTRKFPVDVSRIIGPFQNVTELQLTLPPGWMAELPKDIATSSIAGRYETTYRQEGRVLHMTRRVQGARGVYAPVRVAEVVAWLRAIAADDVEYIQIKPPS